MKYSLKTKIFICVPAVFIVVMLAVAAVILIIHNKESRKEAEIVLGNSFEILRYTIRENKKGLIESFQQSATLNDIGGMLKYVDENKTFFKYGIMRPTYVKMTDVIQGINAITSVNETCIYNMKGELIVFSVMNGHSGILGFVHDMDIIESITLTSGSELTNEVWQQQYALPAGLTPRLGHSITNTETTEYVIKDGAFAIAAYIPIIGKDYNTSTEKMEPVQVGLAVTIQKLDNAFIRKISQLTGTDITMHISGAALSDEMKNYYKSLSPVPPQNTGSGNGTEKLPLIFRDIEQNEQGYYSAILPVCSNSQYIAVVEIVCSKSRFQTYAAEKIKLLSIVYIVAILIIVPITILFVIRNIINPINSTAAMMRRIAQKKDFTQMLDIKRMDEIGELAASFNEMTAHLQKTTTSIDNLHREIDHRKRVEEEIRRSRATLNRMIHSMPFGVMIIDKNKTVRMVNSKAAEISGYSSAAEMIGKKCSDIVCSGNSDACPILTKKIEAYTSEKELLTKDGRKIQVLKSAILIEYENEEVSLESFVDISERKHAEEAMKQLNNKLEDVNNELKNFAYIASHDLREPLRTISSFGTILEKSLKENIGTDDAQSLHYMINGAKRMSGMIEGLLKYSRVNTQGQEFEVIEIAKVLDEILQFDIGALLNETHTKINVPHVLPTIYADPLQMRQLIQNLIANGIKYQPKGNIPEITIKSKPAANNMVRIEITDNGIGISPEYHNTIFGMFKRLPNATEYEGTGIGLAVCKRITQRHNGQIGVESESGKGSTFWFTVTEAKVLTEAKVS
jgi:PAS domain S-box-containing protein